MRLRQRGGHRANFNLRLLTTSHYGEQHQADELIEEVSGPERRSDSGVQSEVYDATRGLSLPEGSTVVHHQ